MVNGAGNTQKNYHSGSAAASSALALLLGHSAGGVRVSRGVNNVNASGREQSLEFIVPHNPTTVEIWTWMIRSIIIPLKIGELSKKKVERRSFDMSFDAFPFDMSFDDRMVSIRQVI